jgi:hypothetical protein
LQPRFLKKAGKVFIRKIVPLSLGKVILGINGDYGDYSRRDELEKERGASFLKRKEKLKTGRPIS